jgi:hypothetical protein
MKPFLRIVGIVVLGVVALAAVGAGWLMWKKPAQRPAPELRVEITPERVARGKYLVRHVGICLDCHSARTGQWGLPFDLTREGAYGLVWDEKMHFPGRVAAANLTPDLETGLGVWSDGEVIRAIREGVDRNGKALFPIMPYGHYRTMSDDDVTAIVAYLRTLKPIRYERPEKSLDMPLPIVEKFLPQPLQASVLAPGKSDHLAYGRYLTTIAACAECHTPEDDRGRPLPGMEYAGGWEMHMPGFRVVTANITPHPDTFMGQATKEEFIGRFRAFAGFTPETAPEASKGRNTVMPWIAYSGMTDEDLGAIYDYLKTVKPIANKVNPFPDAPKG